MTAERETARVVRSWLRTDEHESADRILHTVLARLDSTPQRRPWWPAWRFSRMTSPVRYAIAAAAVLVVALVGYRFLPSNATTPGASPVVLPSPTMVPALPANGPLPPGTYRMGSGPAIFVSVPPGWVSLDGVSLRKHLDEPNEVAIDVYPADIRVFGDACRSDMTDAPVGPTVADLISALRAQESSVISDPTDVTVAGVPGTRFEVAAPAGLDRSGCAVPGGLQVWVDESRSNYLAGVGLDDSIAILFAADTPGGRLLFRSGAEAGASAIDIAERDAIVTSMQLAE